MSKGLIVSLTGLGFLSLIVFGLFSWVEIRHLPLMLEYLVALLLGISSISLLSSICLKRIKDLHFQRRALWLPHLILALTGMLLFLAHVSYLSQHVLSPCVCLETRYLFLIGSGMLWAFTLSGLVACWMGESIQASLAIPICQAVLFLLALPLPAGVRKHLQAIQISFLHNRALFTVPVPSYRDQIMSKVLLSQMVVAQIYGQFAFMLASAELALDDSMQVNPRFKNFILAMRLMAREGLSPQSVTDDEFTLVMRLLQTESPLLEYGQALYLLNREYFLRLSKQLERALLSGKDVDYALVVDILFWSAQILWLGTNKIHVPDELKHALESVFPVLATLLEKFLWNTTVNDRLALTCEQAWSYQPQNATLLNLSIQVAFMQGQTEKVAERMKQIPEMAITPSILFIQACESAHVNAFDTALNLLTQAIQSDPIWSVRALKSPQLARFYWMLSAGLIQRPAGGQKF